MALSDMRDDFITQSGRYDLGTIGGADNGANAIIQSGLRLLDSRVTAPKTWKSIRKDVTAGEYLLNLTHCRSVQEVWVVNADGRSRLEYHPWREVREQYPDPYDELDRGTPSIYCVRVTGLAEDQKGLNSDDYDDEFTYEHEGIIFADVGPHYAYTGLLFLPPADGTYTMDVEGLFYGDKLENDTDVNYWTEVKPDALLYASLYREQVLSRNTEGARDWMAALDVELEGIEKDLVEQQTAELTKIEG